MRDCELIKRLGENAWMLEKHRKMNDETIQKRRKELNDKYFQSEKWFHRCLKEYGVYGYRRNVILLDRFFGDFVFRSKMVVVEIDGSSHDGKEEYDRRRDAILSAAGYKVYRLKSYEKKDMIDLINLLKEKEKIQVLNLTKKNKKYTLKKIKRKPNEYLQKKQFFYKNGIKNYYSSVNRLNNEQVLNLKEKHEKLIKDILYGRTN